VQGRVKEVDEVAKDGHPKRVVVVGDESGELRVSFRRGGDDIVCGQLLGASVAMACWLREKLNASSVICRSKCVAILNLLRTLPTRSAILSCPRSGRFWRRVAVAMVCSGVRWPPKARRVYGRARRLGPGCGSTPAARRGSRGRCRRTTNQHASLISSQLLRWPPGRSVASLNARHRVS
jgi:hypothetical protein